VDYFALKPFLPHPSIRYRSPIDYRSPEVREVLKEVENASGREFKVYVRWKSLEKIESRTYDHCLSFPFFVDVDSNGDVYHCGPQLGKPEFRYGNILEQEWEDIWGGGAKAALERYMANTLDCSRCMPNCRNDAVNRFLWQLKSIPSHVNFI